MTKLIGAHSIIYSTDPEADRALFRDVFKLPHVDAGDGWLIFALPPGELAFHPARRNDVHELYLICDDVKRLMADLRKRHLRCSRVQDRGWGLLTQVSLPGGGTLGVYEPRHARPAGSKRSKTRAPAKQTSRLKGKRR